MKHNLMFNSLLLLGLAPAAFTSNTWYVNGVSGNNTNNCKSPTAACKTIGHAIALATSGDTIVVSAATYGENLTISKSLKIIGSSASTTIIDGGGVSTVLTIHNTSASVILSGMTIRNGASGIGGGVYNSGILTINNSTVSGNLAGAFCTLSRCFPGIGGGIFSGGTLTISNSAVSGNKVLGHCVLSHCPPVVEGGGIGNSGRLTINNSTVSGNVAECFFPCASAAGGGIFSGGTLSISNSTISGNSTTGLGSGINGRATLQNSIVANAGANCYGAMVSNGYNMSSDNTCNFSNSGDRNNTNPMLGTLGNYGGPTQTIPLLSGSPAIDAGNPSGCTDDAGHLLKTDQRGLPRPNTEDIKDQRGCDMGAFEKQSD